MTTSFFVILYKNNLFTNYDRFVHICAARLRSRRAEFPFFTIFTKFCGDFQILPVQPDFPIFYTCQAVRARALRTEFPFGPPYANFLLLLATLSLYAHFPIILVPWPPTGFVKFFLKNCKIFMNVRFLQKYASAYLLRATA